MNKHDANIKKGKLINFQIGIIALISFCYVLHEVSHYSPNSKKTIASIKVDEDPFYIAISNAEAYPEVTIIEKTVLKEPKVIPEKIKVEPTLAPKVVDNETEVKIKSSKPITEAIKINETPAKTGIKTKIKNIKKPTGIHNSKSVDVLPIFPGCNKYSTNDERAVCFQDKIQRMINRRFDRNIGDELGLSGIQRISLYFEIDENGLVTNIKARSKYPEFIKEAKRVANLLPEMEPARRSGAKVKIAYSVPIIFKNK